MPGQDEAEVAASAPLERLAGLCRTPATPARLAAALAAPGDRAAAMAYLDQLVDAGLLVPVPPVGPQEADPLGRLAAWLRAGGESGLAAQVDEVADATRKFGAAGPRERTVLLALLRDRWTALMASAGRPAARGGPGAARAGRGRGGPAPGPCPTASSPPRTTRRCARSPPWPSCTTSGTWCAGPCATGSWPATAGAGSATPSGTSGPRRSRPGRTPSGTRS
ncbi:predicted protein [Streptomyces sp. C]|nr:predicted protein [Streptomyces sp. C]